MAVSDGQIAGKANGGAVYEEAARVMASRCNSVYESKEFSVANGASNYSMKNNVANAFLTVPRAHLIIVRTDQNITFKLNSTGGDAITLTSTEGSFTLDAAEVTDIFFSNSSGSAANVKVVLA